MSKMRINMSKMINKIIRKLYTMHYNRFTDIQIKFDKRKKINKIIQSDDDTLVKIWTQFL